MIDVGRDDSAASGHFVSDEFRRDEVREARSPTLARMLVAQEIGRPALSLLPHALSGSRRLILSLISRRASEIFADGDKLHFRSDDSAPRVVHLRNVAAGFGAEGLAL